MWLFKKKEKPKEILGPTVSSVLCIPGWWRDIDDIADSVFSASNGNWMVIGEIIINPKTERYYKFEIHGRDDKMTNAFGHDSNVSGITANSLSRIENHNFVIHLSGKTGSIKEAYQIALLGADLLNAGGLGVKIETAGKAFEKKRWLQYLKTYDEIDIFELFVRNANMDNKGDVWSCGMHNLGFRDTIVYGEEMQTSIDLISIFGYHQIFDKPVIVPDQTFQADPSSPRYLVTDEDDQPYKRNELFNNPFGMWRLTRMR